MSSALLQIFFLINSALLQIKHCLFRTFISQIHPKRLHTLTSCYFFPKKKKKTDHKTHVFRSPPKSARAAKSYGIFLQSSPEPPSQLYLFQTPIKDLSTIIRKMEADLLKDTIIESIGGGMNLHASSPVSACYPLATRTTISPIWHLCISVQETETTIEFSIVRSTTPRNFATIRLWTCPHAPGINWVSVPKI